MTARRLLRAVTRPLKRLIRPLRLAYIGYQVEHSALQMERLRNWRADLVELEKIEARNQVRLEVRRNEIEKGFA